MCKKTLLAFILTLSLSGLSHAEQIVKDRNASVEIMDGSKVSDIPYGYYTDSLAPQMIKIIGSLDMSSESGKRLFAGYGVYDKKEKHCKYLDTGIDKHDFDLKFEKLKTYNGHSYAISRNAMTLSECKALTASFSGYVFSPSNYIENDSVIGDDARLYGEEAWLGFYRNNCASDYLNGLDKTQTYKNFYETIDACNETELFTYKKANSSLWWKGNPNSARKCIIEIDSEDVTRPVQVCAPWWRVERTYKLPPQDEIMINGVSLDLYSINQATLPMRMTTCLEYPPENNSTSAPDRAVVCKTYYDITMSPECRIDIIQPQCFVDTCEGYVKNVCSKNDIQPTADGNVKDYQWGYITENGKKQRVKVKEKIRSYAYTCPPSGVSIEKCTLTGDVVVFPYQCDEGICTEYKKCIGTKTKTRKECHALYPCEEVYGDSSQPVVENGKLVGFRGKCGETQIVNRNIDKLSKQTDKCVKYKKIIDVITEDKKCTNEATAVDYEINTTITEPDVYFARDDCVRHNDVNHARPKSNLTFSYTNNGFFDLALVKSYHDQTDEIQLVDANGTMANDLQYMLLKEVTLESDVTATTGSVQSSICQERFDPDWNNKRIITGYSKDDAGLQVGSPTASGLIGVLDNTNAKVKNCADNEVDLGGMCYLDNNGDGIADTVSDTCPTDYTFNKTSSLGTCTIPLACDRRQVEINGKCYYDVNNDNVADIFTNTCGSGGTFEPKYTEGYCSTSTTPGCSLDTELYAPDSQRCYIDANKDGSIDSSFGIASCPAGYTQQITTYTAFTMTTCYKEALPSCGSNEVLVDGKCYYDGDLNGDADLLGLCPAATPAYTYEMLNTYGECTFDKDCPYGEGEVLVDGVCYLDESPGWGEIDVVSGECPYEEYTYNETSSQGTCSTPYKPRETYDILAFTADPTYAQELASNMGLTNDVASSVDFSTVDLEYLGITQSEIDSGQVIVLGGERIFGDANLDRFRLVDNGMGYENTYVIADSGDRAITGEECQNIADCMGFSVVSIYNDPQELGFCMVSSDDSLEEATVALVPNEVDYPEYSTYSDVLATEIDGMTDIFSVQEFAEGKFGYISNFHYLLPNNNEVLLDGKEIFPIIPQYALSLPLDYQYRVSQKTQRVKNKTPDIQEGSYEGTQLSVDDSFNTAIVAGVGVGLAVTMVATLAWGGPVGIVVAVLIVLFAGSVKYGDVDTRWSIHHGIPERYVPNVYGYDLRIKDDDLGRMVFAREHFKSPTAEAPDFQKMLKDHEGTKRSQLYWMGYDKSLVDNLLMRPCETSVCGGYPGKGKWYDFSWIKRKVTVDGEETPLIHKQVNNVYLGATNTVSIFVPYIGDYILTAYSNTDNILSQVLISADDFLPPTVSRMAYAKVNFATSSSFTLAPGINEGLVSDACRYDDAVEWGGGVSGIYYEKTTPQDNICAKSNDQYIQENYAHYIKVKPIKATKEFTIKMIKPMPYANRFNLVTYGKLENRKYTCYEKGPPCEVN